MSSVLVLFAACAGGDGGPEDREGRSDTDTSAHLTAVMECDATRAGSLEEGLEALKVDHAYQECLLAANKAAIPLIDKLVPDDHPSSLKAADVFRRYEDAATAMCGQLGAIDFPQTCSAKRTRNLALLVDAYVPFTGALAPVGYEQDQESPCYAALEASLEAVTSASDEAKITEVLFAFATCVETRARDRIGTLVVKELVDWGNSQADATALVDSIFAKAHDAADDVCTLLAATSAAKPGVNQRGVVATCLADAAGMLGDYLKAALEAD